MLLFPYYYAMILGYSIIGLAIASLGGAAPGASNLAVIRVTTTDSVYKAMRIAVGAGIGEIFLALLALCYSTFFTEFFQMNQWVQILFTTVFFGIGLLFLLPAQRKVFPKPSITMRSSQTSFLTGFLLAFLNPPVLLFWIASITLIQKYIVPLTDMSPISVLGLFFLGVFLGKVLVLYGYAVLGSSLQKKSTNNTKFNRIIGATLILIAISQSIRLVIE
ncbi:MAG: LysE family translocator [Bacteroidetes bacterium]|nr:LysE family translocator [Bacteroidota bacterium]